MKQFLSIFMLLICLNAAFAQNVGIGITTPTENFHVVGNKSLFENNFLSIGAGSPVSSFTQFQIKKNVNTFLGMYIDAGATGLPFYGYALNGIAKAYHQFNGTASQYEYYQSNGGTPDFLINGNTKAVFNTAFVGIGTNTPTTAFTGFAMKSAVNNYYGAYIDAGTTGQPFYGYALNGIAKAYHEFNGNTSQYEYYQSNGGTPDFLINGNTKAVFNTAFVGIGTSTPTTAFTGFAMKSAVNNFYGSYIDAGPTGVPFYGYALNGVATAYTTYNGNTSQFEYHHTTDATPDFSVSNTKVSFPIQTTLTIGTSTPLNGFTGLTLKNNVNTYYGAYIDAGVTGTPFYGYALNGISKAYTSFNSTNNAFEYHQSTDATPDFMVNGSTKAVFNTAFVGIGTGTPTTAFTGFAMKSAVNNYFGSYIDAGPTGTPFYGYALNGVATAYTTFSGANNRFEYHHTSDAVPDFYQTNTQAVYPNTSFLGIGTTTPTTAFTGLALKSNANSFFGSYIDAGPTGIPFYGYALNGVATAYTTFSGPNNRFEYHHTSDAVPDFYQTNTQAVFPNTSFLGIGTTTPTTGFTALAIKSSTNSYFGSYIDAGATGIPFYGYALNGVATAYTTYNGSTSQFEYHHTSDAIPDFAVSNTQAFFPNTSFLGIGTTTPTTGATGMAIKNNVAGYYGMYIDAGASGRPFYGYALNGIAKAWTELNGANNWELNYNGARISVEPGGDVGIGTSAPTQKLDVAGTIHASNLNGGATTLSTDAAGNIIRTPSDANLKNNIAGISNALQKVLNLHGVTYNFKDGKRFGENRQMGFLAQELEKIVPEAVSSGGEYKSVNYQVLTALLAEAIKEQQKEIDNQQKENAVLVQKLNVLLKKMDLLLSEKK